LRANMEETPFRYDEWLLVHDKSSAQPEDPQQARWTGV